MKTIDWGKTLKHLQLLREGNISLKKYCCKKLHYDDANCSGDCDNCKYDMDNHISQQELADVMGIDKSRLINLENGKCIMRIEELLFYCEACNLPYNEILVIEE